MSHRSPQDVYAKCLPNNRGYPLWYPEPSNTLPTAHRQDGLQIGDVGVVDPTGRFDVLFNICNSSRHALHQRPGIRDKLSFEPVPVDFDQEVDVNSNAEFPGCVIISSGMTRLTGESSQKTNHYEFVPTSAEGAILILPDGATRHDLVPKARFREVAMNHALEWYEVAAERYGESINGFSLYLITGFYKSRSWSLASFHDAPVNHSTPPSIKVGQRNGGDSKLSRRYWDCTFQVDCRDGPGENHNGSVNQTVYISGFKIAIRDDALRFFAQAPVAVESVPAGPSPPRRCFCVRFLMGLFGGKRKSKHQRRGKDGSVNHIPGLTQPFHPSDKINRFLLNQNPHAMIAIVHDDEWISMVKDGKLTVEDLARDDRLEEFLTENYSFPTEPGATFLESKRAHDPGVPNERSHKVEKFWYPTSPSNQSHVAITRIRAENVAAGLRRIPSGFSVLVEFDGSQRRTKNKPVRLDESITEWDDPIPLPLELSHNVRLVVCASYELSHMLGKGEILYSSEKSIAEWRDNTQPITFSPGGGMATSICCSLLITVEPQAFNYLRSASYQNSNTGWDGHSDLARETDRGHSALLRYRHDPKKEDLDAALHHFDHAHKICPTDHRARFAVLRNLAMAKFFQSQVTGAYTDLEDSISFYQGALNQCDGSNQDRAAILLHLAQTLVYRYGKHGGNESIEVEVKDLVRDVEDICPKHTHERRAAALIAQTCKRYKVMSRNDPTELDKLILELKDAVAIPPEIYFDKPQRLYNLGVALRARFEMSSKLDDLTDTITANKEAVRVSLPGDPDYPEMLTTLGTSILKWFECTGNVAHLNDSISVSKDALQLTLNGHLNRPELLSTYGIALLRRFEKDSKPVDLDKSFSALEEAVRLAPMGHPYRPRMSLSLGDTSFSRYQRFGEAGDLDKSISAIQETLQLTSDTRPNRSEILAALGTLFLTRFRLLGVVDDLQQSIDLVREAMLLIPDSHPSHPRLLGILGTSFLIRYQKHSELPDLAKSISIVEQALQAISHNHPSRDKMLNTLCTSIILGFQRYGTFADLAKAMSAMEPEKPPRATQDGRFDQPELFNDLYRMTELFTKKHH